MRDHADRYACADQLDVALATVDPILPEISAAPVLPVRRDFQDFRSRLTRRWGAHPRSSTSTNERLRS